MRLLVKFSAIFTLVFGIGAIIGALTDCMLETELMRRSGAGAVDDAGHEFGAQVHRRAATAFAHFLVRDTTRSSTLKVSLPVYVQ